MSKGTLYIFCGKMASGKTTLARQIAEQKTAILMCEDELLGKLYPNELTDVPSYIQYSAKLKSALKPLLIDLLQTGVSVVLDFPANTIEQRKWINGIVEQSQAHYEFHYLDTSNAICQAQLMERAVKQPERSATDTVEMFNAITAYFEPPTSAEGFEIVSHKRD